MKKSTVIISVFILLLTFSMGAYAATKYNFTFNGKKQSIDVQLINNKAYVPLNDVTELFGGKVTYDSKSKTYAVTSNATESITPSEMSKTIDNLTVKIDKVVQDSDSLKIYVTYVNNSNDKMSNGSDLSKIVANGKQYSYNSKFNFERWYKKENVPHADTYIEPGVTAEDVIFYAPVDADSINILIRANWTDYRFNNVKITK
ncbi:stalk domain-containing protein [Bacillus ndiopicus]|uniref:stalk domain-containing protein n=1 Tax=Bacillus ndiopicus TaxID=1347368 RepID=UPI0005AAC842|nr:stalk domain-containing protein [Bacillus ndiopicus]